MFHVNLTKQSWRTHSHLMVAGGLLVRSKKTAAIPGTFNSSVVTSSKSPAGIGTAFAVMPSTVDGPQDHRIRFAFYSAGEQHYRKLPDPLFKAAFDG